MQAACATAALGHARCLTLINTGVRPLVDGPAGFYAADLPAAYNLPIARGPGQTIAIVDAYDDPSAEADLAVSRAQYGLPACTTSNGCFRKLNQSGAGGLYPSVDGGWSVEISLDLDMVSAAVCDLASASPP